MTARDGLFPWVAFDSAGVCDNTVIRHLEVYRVADGTRTWSSARWGQLIGELADGDLVATTVDTTERALLVVAGLARADGAVRWSCQAPLPDEAVGATWELTADGPVGQLNAYYATGGTPHGPPPILPAVRLELTDDGCALHDAPGSGPMPVATTSAPPAEWTADGVVIRYEAPRWGGPNAGTTPRSRLVATRGGQPLWTHDLVSPPMAPCLAP